MDLVLRIDPKLASALGQMRGLAEWKMLVTDEGWFLRSANTESNRVASASLPADARYHATADGLLTPIGAHVPVGRLPVGNWQHLADALKVVPLPAALPGQFTERAPIAWVEGGSPQSAGAILLTWAEFYPWGRQAPAARLEPLRMAVSAEGRALVSGTPLPPLAGEVLYWQGDLAIPCGSVLAAHLWPEAVSARLGLRRGDAALLRRGGEAEIIREEQWVEVSRTSIELTARNLRSKGGA